MLKILQIIPNLRKGGAERLVLDICNELNNRKEIQVILIIFADIVEYKELFKKINYKIIPTKYIPSITKKSIKQTTKLQDFIDKYKPDIIHSHLWESEFVLSTINTNAKRFIHFHDNIKQLNNFSFNYKKENFSNFFEKKL